MTISLLAQFCDSENNGFNATALQSIYEKVVFQINA